MSRTSLWRVLRKRLVFKPYRIQMVQQLSDEDHRRRFVFCLQLQDLMSSDDHLLEKVQFSDEAIFHFSGAVNRRNVRIWGSENPHAYVEYQRDSRKSKSVRSIFLCRRNRYWHDISGHVATVANTTVYQRSYSSKTEIPPTSFVRFVST
jgi:hypothetical protein